MKTVLSEKIEEPLLREGLQELESELKEVSSGLNVKIEAATTEGGWVSLKYEGEDSEVFTEVLARDYGLAPVQLRNLELGNTYRGFITDSGRVGYGLYVDIGVLSPTRRDGLYPLHRMRAQLADGAAQPLRQITRRFCLYSGLPINVRIEELEGAGRIGLALTDRQESNFKDWEKYPFDRVVVIGSLPSKVRRSIRRVGLDKDVVKVERLSLTSSVLTCKLGTEAPGVISKLGPQLATAKLYPFIPSVRAKPQK